MARGRGRPTNEERARREQQQRLQQQVQQVLQQVNQPAVNNNQQPEMNDQQRNYEKRRRPLFDGTNWTNFKFAVTIDLQDEEVFGVTSGATPRPAGEGANALAWDRKNWRALRILNDCINDGVRGLVKHCNTAPEVWTALLQMYENRNASNKHTVQQKFYTFTYNENQSARENVSRLNSLVADCQSVGIVLDREGIVTKLLYSLPKSCEALAYAFRVKPDAERTLESLTNLLVDRDMMNGLHPNPESEDRKQAADRKEVQPALVHRPNAQAGHAQSQQRQQRPSNQSDRPNNNIGRNNRNNFDRQSSNQSGGRFNGKCNKCHKRGHRTVNCWWNQNPQGHPPNNNFNRYPPQQQSFQPKIFITILNKTTLIARQ